MDISQFYQEMHNHYFRAHCFHTMQNPDNDATSGNHHVINATYHLVSKTLDPMYPATVEGRNDLTEHTAFVGSTMIEPGLFIRHPNKAPDHETHDDYVGLICSNNILGGLLGDAIYNYGQERRFLVKYYYDNNKNDKPIFNSWFGRFPWLVGLIKKAAGKEINTFHRLGYCVYLLSDVYFNKDRTDVSGRILQWLSNSVMKDEGKLVNYCIAKWEKNIEEKYPNGKMGEVLGIYHGVHHPFSQAMWGRL